MKGCIVGPKKKKCGKTVAHRGQCSVHYGFFKRLVGERKMTWPFLEMAGEAIPLKEKK